MLCFTRSSKANGTKGRGQERRLTHGLIVKETPTKRQHRWYQGVTLARAREISYPALERSALHSHGEIEAIVYEKAYRRSPASSLCR